MTQDEFGKKIGITSSAISDIEKGRRNLTDRNIAIICKEFRIDYHWLTTGEGEMFSKTDTNYIALIDRIMAGEDEFIKNIFKTLTTFDNDDWLALKRVLHKFESLEENSNDDNKKAM